MASFNGGARLYARKLSGGRSPSSRSASFNGGARLYARKLGAVASDVATFEASMGARDCTRASADADAAAADRRAGASMGARDCTRASLDGTSSISPRFSRLQWGRAIVRAQATRNLVKYTSESQKLQWGRAIVRAQAARRRKQRHARRPCFNGGARLYARKLEALGRRVPGAN